MTSSMDMTRSSPLRKQSPPPEVSAAPIDRECSSGYYARTRPVIRRFISLITTMFRAALSSFARRCPSVVRVRPTPLAQWRSAGVIQRAADLRGFTASARTSSFLITVSSQCSLTSRVVARHGHIERPAPGTGYAIPSPLEGFLLG